MAYSLSFESLRSQLGLAGRYGIWKMILIVFALSNLKNLPFAWHIRLIRGLFTHLRSSRVRLASKVGPAALFQPLITSSRSGFLECDYNLHKSNSTYFSDFDVGRLELLVSLLTDGVQKTKKELGQEGSENLSIVLGGVGCNFRKEIKPYEGFEVWTRVLTWDHKWLYVIGHFVKKGAVKPKSYTLQPWRNVKETKVKVDKRYQSPTRDWPHPAIFATGIAKYVAKKGRRTIPPERLLHASGLLPPKPIDSETPPTSVTMTPEGTSMDVAVASMAARLAPDNEEEIMAASLAFFDAPADTWTWDMVEKERQRGMKIAEMYNGLDMLNDEFTAGGKSALGRY